MSLIINDINIYIYILIYHLKNEVFLVLDQLGEEYKYNVEEKFINQMKKIRKQTIPAIRKALGRRFTFNDKDIEWMLHKRHRHQRATKLKKVNPSSWRNEIKRVHKNQRRSSVSIF